MGINPKNFMDEPENFMDEQQQAPASIDFGTNPRKLPEASSGVKTYSALDESTKGLLPGLAIGGLAFGGMDAPLTAKSVGGGWW